MIAVDYYCCGAWPSILWVNVWGRALREECSLHCTMNRKLLSSVARQQQTTSWVPKTTESLWHWTWRGLHSCGWTTTITVSLMLLLLFFLIYSFLLIMRLLADQGIEAHHTAKGHSASPSFLCWKCIINSLQAASVPTRGPTYPCHNPFRPTVF